MEINIDKMKKYILDLSKSIYRTKSYTEYKIKLVSIVTLSSLYTDLTGEELILDNQYIKEYEDKFLRETSYLEDLCYEYFLNLKNHCRLSGKILGTINRSNINFYGLEENTVKLPIKKHIELINEFLIDFNPKIYKKFNYMIMNNQIDTKYKYFKTNLTYYDNYGSNSYILVDKLNNLYDTDVLMHELGHAYAFSVLENRSKSQSLNYQKSYFEMISLYMELAFHDFLKKNNIYMRDTMILENSFFEYMYNYFSCLKTFNIYKNNETISYDELDLLNDAFIYGYGHYLAMLIHEKTLKDKASSFERIDDLLSYQGILNYDEQLKLFDLDRDKLKDMKVLRKRLSSHKENIDKYIK